ncbi:MAG: response regulator [Actinomycetota bacterium]
MTRRLLVTVLFTDIVGSTQEAARIGDAAWRRTLDAHDALVREALSRHGGREIDRAGDGFFASFEVPTDAIRCAQQVMGAVPALGIALRSGIHTGECETRGNGLGGITVHVAARICGLAGPGEVLVSDTVKDLAAGAGFEFESRGVRTLRGLAKRRHLYSLAVPGHSQPARPPRAEPPERVRVMIVDDHPLWRGSLKRLIELRRHARVVAEAADGRDAVEKAIQLRPDIVVMDIDLPAMNGVEATAAMTAAVPGTKVLIMSSSDQHATVLEAVRAGAGGYLLKTAESAEILDAIARLHAGEAVFPRALTGLVLEQMRAAGRP